MARKGSRAKDGRDSRIISRQSLPRPLVSPKVSSSYGLRAFEDRRLWHPERDLRPAKGFRVVSHRSRLQQALKRNVVRSGAFRNPLEDLWSDLTFGIGFQQPRQMLVCVRRKIRKEVLHALGISGKKGVGAGKTQNRNWTSELSC